MRHKPTSSAKTHTSITIVAISLVGSNMRFSCFSGPIRKQVLKKNTKKKTRMSFTFKHQ